MTMKMVRNSPSFMFLIVLFSFVFEFFLRLLIFHRSGSRKEIVSFIFISRCKTYVNNFHMKTYSTACSPHCAINYLHAFPKVLWHKVPQNFFNLFTNIKCSQQFTFLQKYQYENIWALACNGLVW